MNSLTLPTNGPVDLEQLYHLNLESHYCGRKYSKHEFAGRSRRELQRVFNQLTYRVNDRDVMPADPRIFKKGAKCNLRGFKKSIAKKKGRKAKKAGKAQKKQKIGAKPVGASGLPYLVLTSLHYWLAEVSCRDL